MTKSPVMRGFSFVAPDLRLRSAAARPPTDADGRDATGPADLSGAENPEALELIRGAVSADERRGESV
jgi:hypothetical protein